jgi:hypothetical protein
MSAMRLEHDLLGELDAEIHEFIVADSQIGRE